jgi:hypothetical protein
MRSITVKAALAAMVIAVPLSGAFAANGNGGGTNGGTGGGQGYEDFSQKRWFDGIDSFRGRGPEHFGSPFNRVENQPPKTESRDPLTEGLRQLLGAR